MRRLDLSARQGLAMVVTPTESKNAVPMQIRQVARSAEQAAVELATQLGHLTDALEVLASTPTQQDGVPALMLTPEQAADALAISRSGLYALLRCGQLKSVKIGASRRVPAAALERYLAQLSTDDQD